MKLVSSNDSRKNRSTSIGRKTTTSRNAAVNRSGTAAYNTAENRNNTGGSNTAVNRNAATHNNGTSRNIAAHDTGVQQRNTVVGSSVMNRSAVNRNAGSNINKPEKKKKSHVKTVVIIVLIFVIGFAALFISLGFYVDSLDTVFPNVWADGINVSELTLEEAKQALIDEGYERNAEGISATLIFPDESMFTVTGGEAGLSLNAGEAAATAFAFGRQGSFFENEITYIRSLFNRTDLHDLSTPVFDDSIVRELTAEYTHQFNTTLLDSNLEITETGITILIGTGLHPAEETEVFNLAINTLMRAVEVHENLTVRYVPETNDDDFIDLQLLYDHIHIDPVSSTFDLETWIETEDKSASATVSSSGRTFDLDEANEMLRTAAQGQTIHIPIYVLEPEYTQEQIAGMILRDVLAESTTRDRSGNSNRISNIRTAASKVNGTIINPGETFSFNEVVGPRRRDTGFLEANVIIGGVFQPGIGGGICQASSTLHDAVLHTHLQVIERHNHSLRIYYMPEDADGNQNYANDATVAWGNQDYRFRNNTDFPIRIDSSMEGREVTFRIIGTKLDDNKIVIETVTLAETSFSTQERETDEMLIGERRVLEGSNGQNGFRAEVFQRLYSPDGELISRTSVGISRYGVQNRIILVGTAEPPPYVPPEQPYTPPVDGGDAGEGYTDVTTGGG